jgi:hypothetical protein
MANKNPIKTKEFWEQAGKRLGSVPGDDNIKMSKKVWALRLPADVSDYLESLDAAERMDLMRGSIVNKVRKSMNYEHPKAS